MLSHSSSLVHADSLAVYPVYCSLFGMGHAELFMTALLAASACLCSPAVTDGEGDAAGGADDITRDELTAALTAAFGNAGVTISTMHEGLLGADSGAVPRTGMFASGRKYELAIEWEHPVSAWSPDELRQAEERASTTTMSRVMATPDGTRWRRDPAPKGLTRMAGGIDDIGGDGGELVTVLQM